MVTWSLLDFLYIPSEPVQISLRSGLMATQSTALLCASGTLIRKSIDMMMMVVCYAVMRK